MALTAIAVALFAWRAVQPAPASGPRLRPDDRTLIALGETVYRQQCAACHGAQLQGQANWRERGPDGRLPAPPHDPSGHTWHHPDAQLFALTKHGIARGAGVPGYDSAMPAYDGVLTDEQIVAVLSWIKSTWPAEIRAHHDAINAQAAAAR
jgi:mono/diheme cytochrome c family protein